MELLYKETSRVEDAEIQKTAERVSSYIEHFADVVKNESYTFPESSIFLPGDKKLLNGVLSFVDEIKKDNIKYIFLVGIGGSSLGTRAIYEATYLFSDRYTKRTPKIIFIETINSKELSKLKEFIREKIAYPDEFLFLIVSKSGTTTETATNAEILFSVFSEKFSLSDVIKRSIAITDEDSVLWEIAEQRSMSKFAIPKSVGGRFSVFSAAGLIPLALAGIDIGELLERARLARDECRTKDIHNPALASAAILHYYAQEGKNIHNSFFFASELESLGRWYGQLMAESLGKMENIKGEPVRSGITPITSIGTSDLHSLAQLYLAGPKDKITTFIRMKNNKDALNIPAKQAFSLVEGIGNRTVEDVSDAIYEGTKKAYIKADLPFMEIILSDALDVGAYMQYKMIEIMFLAKLFNINAFDQPAVEVYKEESRKILRG